LRSVLAQRRGPYRNSCARDIGITTVNRSRPGFRKPACPAGAISGSGFSNAQILSQIEGLLLLNLEKKPVLEAVMG